MTEEELLRMYAALMSGAFQGSTPSNQLNLLQDVLGTAGISFMPQQPDYPIPDFQIDPETGQPIGVTESVYGNNPVWQGVFNKIDQGETPEAAVIAAINQGAFTEIDKNDKDAINNYIRIGRDYATERFENAQRLAEYQNAVNRAESGVKLSLADVFAPPSEYERFSAGLGKPEGVTAEDLEKMYAGRLSGLGQVLRPGGRMPSAPAAAAQNAATPSAPAGGPTFRGAPTTSLTNSGVSAQAPASPAMRTSQKGGKSAPAMFAGGSEKPYDPFSSDVFRQAFRSEANRRLEKSKKAPVRSEQAQRAAETLALLNVLLQGR